VWVRFPPSAHQ